MAGTAVLSTIKHDVSGAATTFRDGAGNEIGQLCKAWINLNGVNPISTRASFNFSSVTRNAGGDYTFNFTNSMADANYSVSGTGGQGAAGAQTGQMGVWNSAPTASAFRAGYVYAGVTAYDNDWTYAQVFR